MTAETPSPLTRRTPSWHPRAEVKHLTPERLAEMRAEAAECDAHNRGAFERVMNAFKAYEYAAREYGMDLKRVNRNGRSHVPVPVPPYDTWTRRVQDFESAFNIELKRREKEKADREAAEKAAVEKRKADLELARLILRYAAPDDSDWDDLFGIIRGRDQYLDLACAGLETRGDWSDGFYRVESALKRFRIRDERDKEIAADITGCLGSEDGRVFRDTAWSYDALFEIVADKQLVEDAKLCLARADR